MEIRIRKSYDALCEEAAGLIAAVIRRKPDRIGQLCVQ